MVVLDIPMPKDCDECPCSYLIQNGECAGLMMCNAMEFKAKHTEFRELIRNNFVVIEDRKPEKCPMKLEILTKDEAENEPGEIVDYMELVRKIVKGR